MKKNLVLRAALMAALPLGLIVSCAKEVPQNEENATAVKAGPCEIIADIPESKVSLTPGDGGVGLGLAWENTDQLRVISENGGATFDIKNIDGKKATFKGTAVEGTSYTVLYPGSYETETAINERRYDNQVQIGNATDHLEWNAKVTGLTDYSSVTFSGENCRQNGALKFHFKMPADFTKVYSVSLSAPADIFSVDNGNSDQVRELTLSLKDNASTDGLTLGADKIFTAYMMVSWNENVIQAGTTLTIKVKGDQPNPWTKTFVPASDFTIAGGKVTSVKLNDQNWDEPLFWAGSGTETDPYQIKTVKHLQNVSIASAETAGLYFKLMNDIDLENMEWTPINNTGTVRDLNFDGENHKISNLKVSHNSTNAYYNSLFGYLTGSVKDLTIENADVYSGNSASATGVLSGWFQHGSITNVDVTGTNHIHIVNNNSKDSGCGGLVGAINKVTVKDCDVSGVTFTFDQDGVVPQNVGGLTGSTKFNPCTIENCTVNGSSVLAAYRAGGLVGSADIATTITDCNVGTVSSVTVEAAEAVVDGGTGGLVGAGTKAVTFSGCHFNGTVTGVALVGGLTGQIAAKTTYDKCSSAGSVKATGSITDFVSGETASYAGGIAGAAKYSDVLTSCSSMANVTAAVGIVGGLIGDAAGVTFGKSDDSSKSCSYSEGTVKANGGTSFATGSVGGFVGIARSTAVKVYGGSVSKAKVQCAVNSAGGVAGMNTIPLTVDELTVADSEISGIRLIGGIVGYGNYASTLTSCKLAGTSKVTCVSTSYSSISGIGGIVGYNSSSACSITSCEIGDQVQISGPYPCIGGIIGYNSGAINASNQKVTITDSIMNGSVSGKSINVGGMIGRNDGASLSISGGSVESTIKTTYSATPTNIGGVIGNNSGANVKISGTHSDVIVSGKTYMGGIVGVNTGAGIEIDNCTVAGTIESSHNGGDTNSAGVIGDSQQSGTISNCTISANISTPSGYGQQIGGVVGRHCSDAATKVLNIESCKMTGTLTAGSTNSYVGGIAGVFGSGSIKKCASEATINGKNYNGGIAAYLQYQGTQTIEECSFNGTLNTTGYYIAGIVGRVGTNAGAVINNCFAAGTMKGSYYCGGLVGINQNNTATASTEIKNCYAAISITELTDSRGAVAGILGSSYTGVCSITNCLAYHPLLNFEVATADDGVIVGNTKVVPTLSNNYRGANIVMGTTYKLGYSRSFVDDPDDKDGAVYSGTCSAKASELGWDTEVWDLTSSDYPVLKNVAK